MTYPFFVGRKKSMQALDHAFERGEVVLAVQKAHAVDDPGSDDVYEIGVLARLLELERLADDSLRILAWAHRRVVICRFMGETGAFQAEIADISEGPISEAPELIQRTVKRFRNYAPVRKIYMRNAWPPLARIRDPGRVADIMSSYIPLPTSDKQSLLATLDPVARLERVNALLESNP
jgi:ATP-dependent Lon protease